MLSSTSTTDDIPVRRSTAHASLAALGVKLHQLDLFAPIRDGVRVPQKTVRYPPTDKLYDAFIALLAGAHGLVEINHCLRAEPALQAAFGRTACAEQSVVQDTLDACTLLLAWWIVAPGWWKSAARPSVLPVMIFLGSAVALSYQFPIHIGLRTKVQIGSILLYLAAALLSPPLAALAVGLGTLVGELTVRQERSTPICAIVTSASRWVMLALGGSAVAHFQGVNVSLTMGMAAIILWTADITTSPILLKPATGERSVRIIRSVAREAGIIEGIQYLVGLLGALAALQSRWALPLMVLPSVFLYRSSKSAKELHQETMQLLVHMADTVDLRDPYTGGHSRRVTELTAGILRPLNAHGHEADLIVSAARVYDIGKIAMPVRRAIEVLRDGQGTQWDPAIVDAFLPSIADRLSQPDASGTPVVSQLPAPMRVAV